MLDVESLHGHAALSVPIRAFGPKHALDSHLLEDCGDGAEAPEDFRSAAQSFLDESRLRNGHYRSRAHFECIDGAIPVRPTLQDQVKLRRIQLEQIAQQWQPRGSGQVGKRANRYCNVTCERPPRPCQFGTDSFFDGTASPPFQGGESILSMATRPVCPALHSVAASRLETQR